MRFSNTIFLLALGMLATACFDYTRFLSEERSMLARVAKSKLKPEQKIDSLLASSIRVMETALKPINPVKGGKLVAKYYDENESAMDAIAGQVQSEFSRMSLLDQGVFAANFARKPYAKQFADLYPKFKRKYNQIKAAAKFIAFFAKAFGKLGVLVDVLG
ncbi:MAG: hypothetical protein ABMA02_15805 [Saprospiraceae bacterium]